MGLSSFSFFVVGSERSTPLCFEPQYGMALEGYPRSLILAPIDSAYATSYWLSVVSLVLSCPVSEILQVFCCQGRNQGFATGTKEVSGGRKSPNGVQGQSADGGLGAKPQKPETNANFQLRRHVPPGYATVC